MKIVLQGIKTVQTFFDQALELQRGLFNKKMHTDYVAMEKYVMDSGDK